MARPLHQVIHKGGDALGTVEPGLSETIAVNVSNLAEAHGQPRVELLRESSSQEASQHKVDQAVAEGGFFSAVLHLVNTKVGSGEKHVHE